MDTPGERLVRDYVERHNAGVRGGDYGPLGELFAPQAELRFEGVALGPFCGRQAIIDAFSSRGPGDELVLIELHTSDGNATGVFNWKQAGERAGTAELQHDGERITRLVIRAG